MHRRINDMAVKNKHLWSVSLGTSFHSLWVTTLKNDIEEAVTKAKVVLARPDYEGAEIRNITYEGTLDA